MQLYAFPTPERDRLIESCMHLVEVAAKSIARRLPPSFDKDDLMQEGYLGLIAAADTWRPELGPFESRARFLINTRMLDSVRRRHYIANTMEGLNQPADNRACQVGRGGGALGDERSRRYETEQLSAGERASDAEDALIAAIDEKRKRAVVADAITYVAGRARVVLEVYYAQGGQITDAAARLGVDPSRASQIHHDGLRELSARLKRRGIVIEYAALREAVLNKRAA